MVRRFILGILCMEKWYAETPTLSMSEVRTCVRFMKQKFMFFLIDTLTGIIVKIVGKGDVNWTEHRRETYTQNGESKTRRVPVHYSNHEEYFRHEIHLFGSGLFLRLSILKAIVEIAINFEHFIGGRSTLEPGERTFDFSFTIPPNVPASFHEAHCKIKYTVKAKIDLPWAFDIESEKDFIVNDFTTPNNVPAAMVRF